MYPALTVLKAISKEADAILWVGGKKGIEAGLVQREGVPFEAIPAAGIHGVGLGALPGNVLRLVRGLLASLQILKQFKPDVLFFTGGYVAVPMALAGWRIPSGWLVLCTAIFDNVVRAECLVCLEYLCNIVGFQPSPGRTVLVAL